MNKKNELDYTNKEHPLEHLDFFQIINQFFQAEPIKQFMDEFNTMLDNPFPFHHIHVTTYETDKNIVVDIKIPPVKKEQIKLELFDQYLTISLSNHEEIREFNENSATFRNYTSFGSLSRTILLPFPVKENEIKTKFKEGSLIVTIPKKSKPIQIEDDSF